MVRRALALVLRHHVGVELRRDRRGLRRLRGGNRDACRGRPRIGDDRDPPGGRHEVPPLCGGMSLRPSQRRVQVFVEQGVEQYLGSGVFGLCVHAGDSEHDEKGEEDSTTSGHVRMSRFVDLSSPRLILVTEPGPKLSDEPSVSKKSRV